MRKMFENIDGGTAVRSKNAMLRIPGLVLLVLFAVFGLSGSVMAQGSIFGTVANSDVSTPANGEITFVGFLDDTDEEIRIETADGAGYDAGNWFDDFQNYLTEAPGNPYDYYFYNVANSEGFQLSALIPNNSFQQEDIVLAAIAWPAVPVGLGGTPISGTTTIVTWNSTPGLTYHVYRRAAASNGAFFRLDNPAGLLTDPGVVDSFFVDNTVDGVSSYDYVIIAEDGSGNHSPHSAVATINSAIIASPTLASISPTNGTATGGTAITISGSGFDPAGMTIAFGASVVTATVASPYSATVSSPAGVAGSVDVSMINLASVLSSNTLVGGFTYDPNAQPIFDAIAAQSVTEGVLLTFSVSATDADGDTAAITSGPLPGSAVFGDNGDGSGTLNWTPAFTDAGVYNVMFYATDPVVPSQIDSVQVTITVNEAGNQAPVMALQNDTTVAEGGSLAFTISASDLDGEIPTLSATGLPATNATFIDNANGTGDFTFNPDLTQAGIYAITFKALDAALSVDSIIVTVTVTEVNQLPVLAAIGPQNGAEDILLTFLVSAVDGDGPIPLLTSSALPGTAAFVDSLNGTGLFSWTPGFTDAGVYNVTFYATDAADPLAIDSEQVVITIGESGNQTPVLAAIGPQSVPEGGSLSLLITASDLDGDIPAFSAVNMPANAVLFDSANGVATFDFNPDFTQAGVYTITFIADDGLAADTELVDITVTEGGNVAPIFDPVSDQIALEGDSLILVVAANDPDGAGLFPALSITTALTNYSFVDNGDGTGTLSYRPDFFDAGADSVHLFATDFGTPQQTGTLSFLLTTTDVNQAPLFAPVGPLAVAVGDSLVFTILVTDSSDFDTAHVIFLSTIGAPANSSFIDNGDGTGEFTFLPTLSQVGLNSVTFLAVDQGSPQLSTTLPVDITVVTENVVPVIDPISAQMVLEGDVLTINVSASDPDGPAPTIDTAYAPENSTFVDNGNGTAMLIYSPDFVGGTRLTSVVFTASDGIAQTKSLPVLIQVNDAGNQIPAFEPVTIADVIEGETLEQVITASDPDGSPVIIEVDPLTLPTNASFVDSGNGVGVVTFSPDFTQAGAYDIDFTVYDGPTGDGSTLTATITYTFTVIDAGNQAPTIASLLDQTVLEGASIQFSLLSFDPDGTFPALSYSPPLANATLTDNGDGSGLFEFSPDFTQAGTQVLTFVATDGEFADTATMTMVITDNNQLPFVFDNGHVSDILEGDSITYIVQSFDADGTLPFLAAFVSGADSVAADSLPPNMTFVDTRDGFGTLTFVPDHTQGGPISNPADYNIRFKATDEDYPSVYQITGTITFSVVDQNFPPELIPLDSIGPYSIPEGDSVIIRMGILDIDASIPPGMTMINMPDSNANFTYGSGIGTFSFYPNFDQAGSYAVTFIGIDELGATDSLTIVIDVTDAGNQPPIISPLQASYSVPVSALYQLTIDAYDPDLDSVSLEAFPILIGASFIDHFDGTATYSFIPDSLYLDSSFTITFVATDYPSLTTDTVTTQFQVVSFLRGDLDANLTYTMNDLSFLIAYLFRQGPEPVVLSTADVNNDGSINVVDLTYLILFLYYDGPPPPQ